MLGVEMRRAGIFLLMGAALGLIIGGLMAATLITARIAAAGGSGGAAGLGAGSAPQASGATPSASPAPTAAPIVSASVASALQQATIVNERLNRGIQELRSQLDGPFDAALVAETLREMAVAANDGSVLTTRLGTWGPASGLASELQAAYDTTRSIARDALSASLTNANSYRLSATRMVIGLKSFAGSAQRLDNLATYVFESTHPTP